MNTPKVLILAGVAVAIVAVVFLSSLLWCMVHIYKKSTNRRRKKVEVELFLPSSGPKVTTLVIGDEQQVAKKAFQDSGNVLWTNEGKVFLTSSHAEEMFLSTNTDPKSITSIYIKNSPCSACSAKLITHFAECQQKPTIFIGKISHLRDPNHKKGLQQLLKNGFEIQVWQTLHDMMYSTKMTENYIQGLKSKC